MPLEKEAKSLRSEQWGCDSDPHFERGKVIWVRWMQWCAWVQLYPEITLRLAFPLLSLYLPDNTRDLCYFFPFIARKENPECPNGRLCILLVLLFPCLRYCCSPIWEQPCISDEEPEHSAAFWIGRHWVTCREIEVLVLAYMIHCYFSQSLWIEISHLL